MPEVGYSKRRQEWTREAIIEAIQSYTREYGEVPASTDFHPGDCLRSARISAARSQAWLERSERFKEGEYPWPGTVARVFGRWSLAIEAAGFVPRRESVPNLKSVTNIDQAVVDISECLRQVNLTDDPKKVRQLMSIIASKALAALESEADDAED